MDKDLSDDIRAKLRDALGEAQRIGMLGEEPLDSVIDRSLGFVRRIPRNAISVIDLGSGGGDPGLVIAMGRPGLRVTLVDRRAKRTDVLTRLVGRLDLGQRVEVIEADVAHLPQMFPGREWDIASSRGFGSPSYTAGLAEPLLPYGGRLLVSEPPGSDGSRWNIANITTLGMVLEDVTFGIASLLKVKPA